MAILIVVLVSVLGGAISERVFGYRILDRFFPRKTVPSGPSTVNQKILTEESVVIDVVDRVSPSVVTVGITKTQSSNSFINPFDPFGFFSTPNSRSGQTIKQDIGSGFVVDSSGLIITNKHVVEDTQVKYRVITKDGKEYAVNKIYRDLVNDLAILKIDPSVGSVLKPLELGDSSNLKVGQFVIAIGTALGEFPDTVTTGVVSGLGRGIVAGSPFEGYAERLDNVIQTDAAINPGNSGGPLLNSAGQAIGINVAVASQGENIGFALPINVVKDSLKNFQATGSFSRAYLGVRYQMIAKDVALLNNVPQGAYVVAVVSGSPAEKAGLKEGDIIIKIDGQNVQEDNGGLAKIINQKKIGDRIKMSVWRDEKEVEIEAGLTESSD